MIADLLLSWYALHARVFPWREPPGSKRRPEPYRTLLSEVMLQQTRAEVVVPYFAQFMRQWPTVQALAEAKQEDVLSAWSGLGYYARGRHLHQAARLVAARGGFPQTPEELEKLPGVGPYTSAAIAAIAFGRPVGALDTNAARVVSRLSAHLEPLPQAHGALQEMLQKLVPHHASADFAQAMMDLGATVCVNNVPRCGLCPVRAHCRAYALGIAAQLPPRSSRVPRRLFRILAFYAEDPNGAVLLRRRSSRGLLGGMQELPSSLWTRSTWEKALETPPPFEGAEWYMVPGLVRCIFTHVILEARISVARVSAVQKKQAEAQCDGTWVPDARLDKAALARASRSMIEHAKKALQEEKTLAVIGKNRQSEAQFAC